MKKISAILLGLLSIGLLTGCGGGTTPIIDDDDPSKWGTPDISTATWLWQKEIGGQYTTLLYLTFHKNAEDVEGTERCIELTPSKNTMKANTCTEEGLDRYVATYVANGVTIQSHKDVVTYATGHHLTQFYDGDNKYHYKKCECGMIDFENKFEHNFIDDGNHITKTCKECSHVSFTDEYIQNKMQNIKNEIAKYVVPTTIEQAIDNLKVNSTSPAIIAALNSDDCALLTTEELATLISVNYNYQTLVSAEGYNNYCVAPYDSSYIVNGSYVEDEQYRVLRKFNVPTTIPSRGVASTPDGKINHNPENGMSIDGHSTVFNYISLPSFPAIDSNIREVGFKISVPKDNIRIRLLGYYSYPTTVTKSKYTYMCKDITLSQGWNTVSFTDLSLFNDITHILIEVKDSEGSMPAGDYFLTDFMKKYDDSSSIAASIASLPEVEDLTIVDCQNVLSTYALYERLDETFRAIIPGSDKLVALNEIVTPRFSLPYGSSMIMTNFDDLVNPAPGTSINGNSMYVVNDNAKTYFNGLIKASNVIPCANQTLGFLTYQAGDNYYGKNNTSHLVFRAIDANEQYYDFCTATSVHITGNWYLHYVPLAKIEEYCQIGAKTIWGTSSMRFFMNNIMDNTNPLYLSIPLSFDVSLISK